ncbi:unnamed protein product [Peniophora sp. CBMAI 1063]|nr:unnamed protein product [Peniophora sp. CBMAI 1063]
MDQGWEEAARLMNEDTIRVNRLTFCKHGHEYCNHCSADHRLGNDEELSGESSVTDEEITETLEALGLEPGSDAYETKLMQTMNEIYSRLPQPTRKPLSIAGLVYDTGRKTSHSDAPDAEFPGLTIWACREHKRDNCPNCFNWKKLLRSLEKKKDDGKLKDNEQIISLLQAMGVIISPDTKLSADVLQKKMNTALKFSQGNAVFSASSPLDPNLLPSWKTQEDSLSSAMTRGNLIETEAYQAWKAGAEGKAPPPRPRLYDNAFNDARQSIWHLAQCYEKDIYSCVLQDADEQEAICIRLIDARALDEKTPVIILAYQTGTAHEPISNVAGFLEANVEKGYLGTLTCTPQEQALLRHLLLYNSKSISDDYKPVLADYEQHFRMSFIAPLAPLSQFQIGKVMQNLGCALCGRTESTSRCSSCLSIVYCGAACQKADWKRHKQSCKTLAGGTWVEATFCENPLEAEGAVAVTVNHSSGKIEGRQPNAMDPPPNVHGTRPFIVKIQRPLYPPRSTSRATMLVYDQKRTFQGHITAAENPRFWREALPLMPFNSSKQKIYRWAKRAGDWRLSVCLDREVGDTPQW